MHSLCGTIACCRTGTWSKATMTILFSEDNWCNRGKAVSAEVKNSAFPWEVAPVAAWCNASNEVCFCYSHSNLKGAHNYNTIVKFGRLLSITIGYIPQLIPMVLTAIYLCVIILREMWLNRTGEPPILSKVKGNLGTTNNRLDRRGRGPVVGSFNYQRGLCTLFHSTRFYSTKVNKQKRDVDTTRGLEPKTLSRLKTVWNVNAAGLRTENLFSLLKDLGLWTAAYKKLSTSKGSHTIGTNQSTIDGLALEKLLANQKSVLDGTYRVGGTRRVLIPKPDKLGETRPLGIPDFEDRIVQEVVRSILEFVYEPKFLEYSHGKVIMT